MSSSKKVNKCSDLVLSNITPLTKNQESLFKNYRDEVPIIAAIGLAGTGKTFSCIALALEQIFDKNSPYKELIIIRNNIPVREIGHLPGTEDEKSEVYEKPYVQICNELFNRGDSYGILKQRGIVKFGINSFLQGMTFFNSIIVVDEVQNYNFRELDMLISRAGENTRFLFCGDTEQSYLKFNDKSGLGEILSILNAMTNSAIVNFSVHDIVRSGLVKDYLLAKYSLVKDALKGKKVA